MGEFTDLLYARPSFIEGVARIGDFAGGLNEYNVSSDGDEVDRKALESDWRAIGADMWAALRRFCHVGGKD